MKRIITLILIVFILTSCGDKEVKKEIYCIKGELVGDKCEYIEENDKVMSKCEDGYTLNEKNGKCENTITIAAKQVSKCPNGYYIGSDYWCFSEETFDKEVKLNCESPNIADGDKFSTTYIKDNLCFEKLCIKESPDGASCLEFKETQLPVVTEASCPEGMKKDGDVCRKKYWMNRTYSCESGELKDKECIILDSVDKTYYCEDHSFKVSEDKTKCRKITYYEVNEK